MGGVVGLMPVTGLTLPFFSSGGTSLLVSMVAIGLLLNIARRGQPRPTPARERQVDLMNERSERIIITVPRLTGALPSPSGGLHDEVDHP